MKIGQNSTQSICFERFPIYWFLVYQRWIYYIITPRIINYSIGWSTPTFQSWLLSLLKKVIIVFSLCLHDTRFAQWQSQVDTQQGSKLEDIMKVQCACTDIGFYKCLLTWKCTEMCVRLNFLIKTTYQLCLDWY